MGRIIIDNQSSLTDSAALECCVEVMRHGRISNALKRPQYCYATSIGVIGMAPVVVCATVNKNSDKFTVLDDQRRTPC